MVQIMKNWLCRVFSLSLSMIKDTAKLELPSNDDSNNAILSVNEQVVPLSLTTVSSTTNYGNSTVDVIVNCTTTATFVIP
jgi:hypothetical protein